MSDFNIEDYSGLAETGFGSAEPVAPEDEFFHSLYIAGQNRKNHMGTEELAGKLQVRGVEYNLDKVFMVIMNIKEILVKAVQKNNKENIECFSYKTGEQWKGTSGRICGTTSAERASNDYCNICRSQIIVSGLYCEENGNPVIDKDNKPTFIFIRAKGMKYSNVSTYLSDMYNKEFEPLFTPVTPQSTEFERKAVNNKRCVSIVKVGEANSNYGVKKVFELESGQLLPNQATIDILKLTKKTLDKFNEKFDWSLKRGGAAGYGTQEQKAPGILNVDDKPQETQQTTQEPTPKQQQFSFDDIQF
jgi:hypothetical protein